MASKSKSQRRREGMFGFSPRTAVEFLPFRIFHNQDGPKNKVLANEEFGLGLPVSDCWLMCCPPIIVCLNMIAYDIFHTEA